MNSDIREEVIKQEAGKILGRALEGLESVIMTANMLPVESRDEFFDLVVEKSKRALLEMESRVRILKSDA